MFGNHFVDRPGHAVAGIDVLHDVVKLEAAHPVILDQIAGLARAQLALVRVDRGKGDADIVMLRGEIGDLVVRDALCTQPALAIDGEQTEGDLLLTIDLGDFRHFGPFTRGLEIGARRIEKCAHHRIFGIVARNLGMDMHVDRAD